MKPCRACGKQPMLKSVSIAFQPAVMYQCVCGRMGAARKEEPAAQEAWDDFQAWPCVHWSVLLK